MGQDDARFQPEVAAGDEAGFGRPFRAHHAELTGLAARCLTTREAAEEVVQVVFLEAWARRRPTKLDPYCSLPSSLSLRFYKATLASCRRAKESQ
jgi:DNA-directed RNA polymerase specialized sigma24 family protein